MGRFLLWCGPALELAILAGLIARGRVRRAYALVPVLVGLITSAAVVGVCPACNTWRFWINKELLHGFLFLVLGVEVAIRVFARVPGAAREARWWFVVVAAVTVVLLATGPKTHPAFSVLPKLSAGLAWLYLGISVTMLRFVIPADPVHKAVLLGFAPYLLLYAATWGQVKGPVALAIADVVNPAMFILVLCILLVAAWAREAEPPAEPELVDFLWPWRNRRRPRSERG